ncbi:hypothetical protein F2S72_08870 [Pseudomonas syringae pv. actinidiae]|nr:hypothetical protein [Pseudomonas syringae pv. actinidiae]
MAAFIPPPLALQTEPLTLLAYYLIEGRPPPYTWIVGDDWLVYDGQNWVINADEPAQIGEVEKLLVQAGGCTLWVE